MKRKLSIIAAIVFLFSVSYDLPCDKTENEPSEEFFETQALNNYILGYMSWGVKQMGLDSLQEALEKSGRELPEVRVAVIDSGINMSNKYLQGRYTDDGYSFLDDSTDVSDEQYHGTVVSGIIADGTSSNVKVLPIKVNDASGKGKLADVRDGIYYAIEHNADVINLSLSSYDPNLTIHVLDDAISEAVSKGIVVVVASGNQSSDTAYRYPANLDTVLTITSVDRYGKIADSANTGAEVDFALPGVNVLTPYKTYAYINSGTSLSTPHAAAAAALLKTWDKSLTQQEVFEILKLYAVDLGDKGFDNTYGWGMIDLSGFDFDMEIPGREKPEVMLGDVNLDGEINAEDLTVLARHVAKIEIITGDNALLNADVNLDGEINAEDLTVLARHVAKIEIIKQ